MTTHKKHDEQSRPGGSDSGWRGEKVPDEGHGPVEYESPSSLPGDDGVGALPPAASLAAYARASLSHTGGAVPVEQVLAAVDAVESLMVLGTRESRMREALGIPGGRLRRYMALVRQRWAREGRMLDRSARRDTYKAQLREVYHTAMDRKRGVPVGIGGGMHKLELVPDPDLRAATDAIRTLAMMDGDMEQTAAGAAVNLNVVQHIQQALGMTAPPDPEEGK